jgi:hypothetical protein
MSAERELLLEYLLTYLEDEFARVPQVRLRVVPDSQELGVVARTESREYFFPAEWVKTMKLDRVRSEVQRIKDGLKLD